MGLKDGHCRKGFYFSTDALFGLFILVVGISLLGLIYTEEKPRTQISYLAEDIISTLANVRVDEIDNDYLNRLISDGNITENDTSILEQIGILWATGKKDLARNLAMNISLDLIPEGYGFSFIIGNETLYSNNMSVTDELATYKSLITGIQEAQPIKGTSTRIYLSNIGSHLQTEYLYFGGFVGQGNISRWIDTIPADANITEIRMELDVISNFSVYMNNALCNDFNITPVNMTSNWWNITSCKNLLVPGVKNNISLIFENDINISFIGGGYIGITFDTDEIFTKSTNSSTYYFPGIEGLINLYSGINVPGTLSEMEIYLHYFTNHSNTSNNTFYVTVGNTTVHKDNYSTTEMSVLINNTNLSGNLDYAMLSNRTVPLRIGFENVTDEYIFLDKGNGDVIAITDVSGSMSYEFDSNSYGIERFCNDIHMSDDDSMRLAVAKCILKNFAQGILYNITGNRVGLVTYHSSVRDSLDMTTNLTDIIDDINQYYANGATCTACGVTEAATLLARKGLVDILSKEWRYSNDPTAKPGWTEVDFDDSGWTVGYQDFGFGQGSDTYTGNVIFADLWDNSADSPQPVDFQSGINSTANTMGWIAGDVVTDAITNPNFDGPSTASWTEHGTINTSTTSHIAFQDDFETDLGWTHGGLREQWQRGTPLGRGGGSHGNPDPDHAHSGSNIWGEDCIIPTWNGDYRAYADSWLVSPTIDCSSCSDTILRFWRWLNVEQPIYDQSRVWVRDSGGTWYEVWENPTELTDNSWSMQEIDISSYADGNSNLQVGFGTETDGGWEYSGWNLDDIMIYQDGEDYFGLYDFWLVDSRTASFGYLSQNFTSPSASPNNVTVNLIHSINLTLFNGAADVFCNLTHDSGETTIFSQHWEGATIPAEGPISEEIDVTSYIDNETFVYTLECGAYLSGADPTVVAFDNISVLINYSTLGDDGWDWEAGYFGFSDDVSIFHERKQFMELVANRNDSDVSGAYGIQIYISQEMIDVINSPGGEAWLSFDYRWDARDDGGSSVFETDDEVWIKGYFESPASGKHWLGTEQSSEGGDTTAEIWRADDPDTEVSARFSSDISGWIDNGPGWYYLAIGGKLLQSSTEEYGAWEFDNVQLAFTNTSYDTYYRNEFYITNINDVFQPIQLNITSDGGADVYLNDALMDSWTGSVINRNIAVDEDDFLYGKNILAVKLKNSDATGMLHVDFFANITNRQKAMIIMSDGESNDCVALNGAGTDSGCNDCGRACCPGSDGVIDEQCPQISDFASCGWSTEYRNAAEQLVNMTCFYNDRDNISIYTIAFGEVATCGKLALNLSALCDEKYTDDNPHYFESDNPEGLAEIYGHITNELRLAFSVKKSQVLSIHGNHFESSRLYPDSYISMVYAPIVNEVQFGEMPLFFESDDFGGCSYNLTLQNQIRLIDAQITPYSAQHWTSQVQIRNSKGNFTVFNLTEFSDNYANLGDPFPISIPGSYFTTNESNIITITTGDSPTNITNCSKNTTLLYTALINLVNYTMPYNTVLPRAIGCRWNIDLDNGNNVSINVPYFYSGPKICNYTNSSHNISGIDQDDSYDVAMFGFLQYLDYNNDGRVFVNLNKDDLVISAKIIRDIPYLWGPTITEVRIWK